MSVRSASSVPAALVLAAGASRRLGFPKQLVQVHGEPLLRRTARLAVESGCHPVTVVLGAHAAPCRDTLRGLPVGIFMNPAWEEGMASSLRAGLAALPADASAVLLLACDQPALDLPHLARLLHAHRQHPDAVIASAYADTRGVPALFPSTHFQRLAQLQGDQGARGLLQGSEVVEVLFPRGEWDVDQVEDLPH